MQTVTEIAIERAKRGVFTRQEVACWIKTTGPSLDALLKRAVASGEVLRITRGLFCLHNRYTRASVNPLELAQRIHGPSYISLETALSRHGWIPEAVYAVTSVSAERSRAFDTPFGPFSYTRVPQQEFYAGVARFEMEDGGSFLMATPLKALADYVYVHRRAWTSADPLRRDLRVEEDVLATLRAESIDELMKQYRAGRVRRFLSGLRKDLKL